LQGGGRREGREKEDDAIEEKEEDAHTFFARISIYT